MRFWLRLALLLGFINQVEYFHHRHVIKYSQPLFFTAHDFADISWYTPHHYIASNLKFTPHLWDLVELIQTILAQLGGNEDTLAKEDFGVQSST